LRGAIRIRHLEGRPRLDASNSGKEAFGAEQIDVTLALQESFERAVICEELRFLASENIQVIVSRAKEIQHFAGFEPKFPQRVRGIFKTHNSLRKFFESILHAFANGQLVALYIYFYEANVP
jgi:hypothetical protein